MPAQMPEHALEEMSGSVPPLGIEATRSKSVVLPSSIADAGVRAVHGEQAWRLPALGTVVRVAHLSRPFPDGTAALHLSCLCRRLWLLAHMHLNPSVCWRTAVHCAAAPRCVEGCSHHAACAVLPVGLDGAALVRLVAVPAGGPVGSGKALKPSRMSSQGLFAMGVMQVRALGAMQLTRLDLQEGVSPV